MRNDIRLRFQSNPGKEYEAVVGTAILTEEFGETLDSFSCVLDGIGEGDRLLKAKPYERVLVRNASDDGYPLKRTMLLDTLTETRQENADGTYKMAVSLMSETKLLEKIQLPNVSVSHYEDGTSPTIATKIDDYMTLYCPKWKKKTGDGEWGYEPIISWDIGKGSALYAKFGDAPASDMSMSAPTLRQALTNLMLQKGCIPQVKDGILSFLDLKEEPGEFLEFSNLTGQVRAMASDSYATDLVASAKNVLDDGNEVMCETVGFRDRDNVLLKSLENLQIETRLPIYNVTKCIMCYPNRFGITLYPENSYLYTNGKNLTDGDPIALCGFNGKISGVENARYIGDGSAGHPMELIAAFYGDNAFQKGSLKNLKVHFCNLSANHYFKEVASASFFNVATSTLGGYLIENEADFIQLITLNDQNNQSGFGSKEYISPTQTAHNFIGYRITVDVPQKAIDGDWEYLWIESDFIRSSDSKAFKLRIPLSKRNKTAGLVELAIYDSSNASSFSAHYEFEGAMAADITKNVVEKAKREILETDYTDMPSQGLYAASKYRYGTVSYTIGDKKISGFSDNWSEAVGWWTSQQSTIEALWKIAENGGEIGVRARWGFADGTSIIGNWTGTSKIDDVFASNLKFPRCFFDISYQPLNTMAFTATKTVEDDLPYPLEQADNQDSGTMDFDRLTANEQDKADRIGNETLAIAQVSDTGNDVNALNSQLGNKVCFKRQICFEENFTSASYQLSEKAVLRNYFTAITTKYRAYEYVDYSSSTTRKERDRAYLLITDKTYGGAGLSDKIGLSDAFRNLFWQGWRKREEEGYPNRIRSVVEGGYTSDSCKNETSILTWKGGLIFNYEQYDNVSAGTYLPTGEIDTKVGGVRQKWDVWSYGFREKRCVWLYSYLPFYDMALDEGDYAIITGLPSTDFGTDAWKEASEPYRLLWLGGAEPESQREYRQDNAEVINETIQLDLWCPEGQFVWTDRFLRNSPLVAYEDGLTNITVNIGSKGLLDSFGQDDNGRLPTISPWRIAEGDAVKNGLIKENGDGTITIDWSKAVIDGVQCTELKVTGYYESQRKRVDICGFRLKGASDEMTLGIYPNDTRTLKVVGIDGDGMPYEAGECADGLQYRGF